MAPPSRARAHAALFVWTLALRAATCALLARLSGIGVPDLSILFDGHVYQLVARTLPRLYVDVHAVFPEFPKSPTYLTAWFPAYPLLIALGKTLLGDFRLAALAVSWLCSCAAVGLFYELARRYVRDPFIAALLFSFLPPTWLLTGSFAFVEPLFTLLAIGTMYSVVTGRRAWGVACAGLAIVAQKSGVLLLPAVWLSLWNGSVRATTRAFAPYLLALLPAAALQGYLYSAFGDALINVATHRRVYGGAYLSLPFQSLLAGLLDPRSALPGMFWLRKAMVVASVAFYAGVWVACRRDERKDERPLLAWLGVFTAFNVCLAGAWGYYAFARLCVVAAPAALLLVVRRIETRVPRYWLALAAAPLAVAYDALDALGHFDIWTRNWAPEYFVAVAGYLRAWR